MLVRLALLLIAVPAVALAQDAPATRATMIAAPPSAAAAPAPAAPTPAPTMLASTAVPPPADPAECRSGCAQTNYFCRAGDNPDNCGANWSQCVAACDLPDLNPSSSTGP